MPVKKSEGKTTAVKKTAAAKKTIAEKRPARGRVSDKAEAPVKAASKKSSLKTDLDLVECIAEAMDEKKGLHIVSMDLREIIGASFDFFVVCEASSGPQVRAIADEISEQVYRRFNEDPLHKEGYANAEWVLLDFGGVVAHIFLDTVRQHYRLEELWGDSAMRRFKEESDK